MTDEGSSAYWYRSEDGRVTVPACSEPGWETVHESAGEPPSIASVVKRRRTVAGEFMFMMAKQYGVDAKHVLPAERLVREVYLQGYQKRFQQVDYGPIRRVSRGGRDFWQAEMELTHERLGRIAKIERTFVQDTNVFVVSAEGQPEQMVAHVPSIRQWLDEARFAALEAAALRPSRSLGPLIEALGGRPAAAMEPPVSPAMNDAFLATMASDGPPPGLLDSILVEQVLPIVQPHEWAQRESSVNRSLCWLPRIAGTPWLAFQITLGETVRTVMRDDMNRIGLTADQLEKAAVRNLSRSRSSWAARQLPGPGGKTVDMLFCQDSPHACERILERPFLLHAKAMLRAESLAAAVPHRGLLVVARFDDFGLLMALARHLHDDAKPQLRVSPWVFAVQGGEISGRFFEENGQVGLDAVTAKH